MKVITWTIMMSPTTIKNLSDTFLHQKYTTNLHHKLYRNELQLYVLPLVFGGPFRETRK